MSRLLPLTLAALILTGCADSQSADPRAAAFSANARLSHSVNFGDMLEAPQEGAWGLKIEERFFDLTKAAGFTAIRVPIRWNAHALAQAPYTVDPAFFDRVDWVVAQARKRGLSVILDFHHYLELMADPAGHRERFLAIWSHIAEHYRNQPEDVLFEVLNEPNDKLNTAWNDIQPQALAVIRKSNPSRVVIVGGANWSDVSGLSRLQLPDDPNLIVTFHDYSPFSFTHQGADWITPSMPTGVPWPTPGLRLVSGWQNWSWDIDLGGNSGGLSITPKKTWGALYAHRDDPLKNVREVVLVTDRPAHLRVVCLEQHTDGANEKTADVTTQAGVETRIPIANCGGNGTVRDVWLQSLGDQVQPAYVLNRLQLVTDGGPLNLLGSADDEVKWPLQTAAAWGKAHHRPIFMGEFGAYSKGDMASRVRWAAAKRTEAERLGISWAWWELASGFGLYDPKLNTWNLDLLRALRPGANP